MINAELQEEIVNFIRCLATCCKGCLRKGATCSTCPCFTATALMNRIEPVKLAVSPLEVKSAAVVARKALIVEKIRRGHGEPCYAGDIRIPGCSAALRSLTLSEMVKDGIIERHFAGSRQLHSYTIKEQHAAQA